MIAKFFELFGVAGTLSVLAWIAGGAMVLVSRRARHRWRWMFMALAAAVAGVLLGNVTTRAILSSTLDDREEIARAIAMARRAVADGSQTTAGEDGQISTRFAEDSRKEAATAAATAAGVELPTSTAEKNAVEGSGESIDLMSVTALPDNAAAEPEYARDGKKERAAGKKVESKFDKDVVIKKEEVTPWYLKEKDYRAARILETVNWLFSRLVLLAAIGMIVWVYLRAFNATRQTRYLLPIGGHWLDNLSPRSRVVLVAAESASVLSPEIYASAALRRGENLIYLGARDPWAGIDRLPRLDLRACFRSAGAACRAFAASREERSKSARAVGSVFGWALKAIGAVCRGGVAGWTRAIRALRAALQWKVLRWMPKLATYLATRDASLAVRRLSRQIGRALLRWEVPKIVAGSRHMPPQNEFLLDGAWFGQYAVVVSAAGAAPGVLSDLVDLLWERHASGAAARQTVHLLWTLPQPPAAELLAALRHIAGGTNIKLVVWNGGAVPAELREGYDEVCDVSSLPE
ncbi:MAG: hypothetical protein WCS01_01160 [bacterium]